MATTDSKSTPELTGEQYRLVLETIASRCDTLNHLLIQTQSLDASAAEQMIEAAQALATYIGSMADNAAHLGGEVVGNHDRWNYGRTFAVAGKGSTSAPHAPL